MGITIKDIAERANVSVTTVSRAINNKPDVSEETKKKILKIIDELGYNPNSMARGLVLKKTYTIGLIIPDISNPFFPEVARGVEEKANEMGYSVIFCNTDNDGNKEKKAIELLKGKQVDGIIVSLTIGNKDELSNLEKENFPVVQIDRMVDERFPAVIIDNFASAYEATRYLIELGHKRIAHVTGNLQTKTGRDRLKGFKRAVKVFGLDCEDLIFEGDYSKKSGYSQMKKLLQIKNRPTAVFFANDLMAVGGYEVVFEQGLSIPEDISIVGHDDINIASLIRPGLTTMVQPKRKLGQKAVDILVKKIDGGNSGIVEDPVLRTKLLVRESSSEVKK